MREEEKVTERAERKRRRRKGYRDRGKESGSLNST
jgi:hypothetical protein